MVPPRGWCVLHWCDSVGIGWSRSQLKANPFQHTVHLHSTHQNWGTTSPLTDIHTSSVLHSRKGLMLLHQPLTIAKIQHVVGLSCDCHVIVDDFNHFGKICHCKNGFSKHILYYFTEAATYDIYSYLWVWSWCGYYQLVSLTTKWSITQHHLQNG